MAAENCFVFDPWMPHYSHEPWGLGGDILARENELLTRALQFSLYDPSASFQAAAAAAASFTPPDCSPLSGISSAASGSSSSGLLVNHLGAATEAMEMGGRRRSGPLAATGKVAKRKSRPSKKRPTTYINADMANFREMVQRVTGVQVGAGEEQLGSAARPLEPAAKAGTQLPAAVRSRAGLLPDSLQQVRLPTLDTSELFLDRTGASPAGDGSLASGSDEALDGGFDFESSPLLFDFATFDSWAAMAMQ